MIEINLDVENVYIKGYSEYESEREHTTFWMDFTIAEKFGTEEILDTYRRVFKGWQSNYKYLTELAMVLCAKCWEHGKKKNKVYEDLYSLLYYNLRDWCMQNLKGEELRFFYVVTD